MTCACRVVSLSQLSTQIKASSDANRVLQSAGAGAEIAGFPATAIRPRIRPSPGVRISSARQLTGYWPSTSPMPRTREANRPNSHRSPVWSGGFMNIGEYTAGMGNNAPPGRSTAPSAVFSTNTSQVARVPNSCVHAPIRL